MIDGSAQDKLTYTHPIPYAPLHYICYKTDQPILIDGKADELIWSQAEFTSSFIDIEGDIKPKPYLDTRVKMLWDSVYFYFYAELEEPHIWATLKNRDDVIYWDDDFEIFIDPDGDAHNYYEFEVNAYNTLWDLFMMWPYREDRSPNYLFQWTIDSIQSATHIDGTLNDPSDIDQGWSVEMAIPWQALLEMAPNRQPASDGSLWRINFSRVDWPVEINNDNYQKIEGRKENNWVWSPQGYIAMHMPELWGTVQFSDVITGTSTVNKITDPDAKLKWALWQLYYQQKSYFKKHQSYSSDQTVFTIPSISDCDINPSIYSSPTQFEIIATSCNGKITWHVNQDGRLYKSN